VGGGIGLMLAAISPLRHQGAVRPHLGAHGLLAGIAIPC